MTLPSYLRVNGASVQLKVRLQPRASRDEIGGAQEDALKVRVTAPPLDSAANQALVRLLADTLHCPKSSVRLVRGQTSRVKTLDIDGMSPEEIARRLAGGS